MLQCVPTGYKINKNDTKCIKSIQTGILPEYRRGILQQRDFQYVIFKKIRHSESDRGRFSAALMSHPVQVKPLSLKKKNGTASKEEKGCK